MKDLVGNPEQVMPADLVVSNRSLWPIYDVFTYCTVDSASYRSESDARFNIAGPLHGHNSANFEAKLSPREEQTHTCRFPFIIEGRPLHRLDATFSLQYRLPLIPVWDWKPSTVVRYRATLHADGLVRWTPLGLGATAD